MRIVSAREIRADEELQLIYRHFPAEINGDPVSVAFSVPQDW